MVSRGMPNLASDEMKLANNITKHLDIYQQLNPRTIYQTSAIDKLK